MNSSLQNELHDMLSLQPHTHTLAYAYTCTLALADTITCIPPIPRILCHPASLMHLAEAAAAQYHAAPRRERAREGHRCCYIVIVVVPPWWSSPSHVCYRRGRKRACPEHVAEPLHLHGLGVVVSGEAHERSVTYLNTLGFPLSLLSWRWGLGLSSLESRSA